MSLSPDTRLGSYTILSLLGKGGMGEVWRARDSKLDRDVAIKVLPEAMACDKERTLRFEREAKLLASLNHTNIAAIHGFEESDGKKFLVLEFVDGETLAQRLKSGGFAVEDTLDVAKQMAEALESAHEKGVIHRDLKPGNVMIRSDGTVKVLDFGLARAMADDSASTATAPDSPTITADYTKPGVVLGTAPYMSPEQARGRPVDKRSDIWSFGVILYECLTGQMLFHGETVSDSISAILQREPDWESLPASTPNSIRVLLRRCLAKDRKRRLQAIGDARVELEESTSIEMLAERHTGVRPATNRGVAVLPWVLCGILALVLVFSLNRGRTKPTRAGAASESWEIRLPRNTSIGWSDTSSTWSKVGYSRLLAISRDGTRIIQTVRQGRRASLYLKDGPSFTLQEVEGTQDARGPFFSPDGQWVGFDAEGLMQKVRLPAGGAPEPICAVESTAFDATWLTSDVIVYSTDRGLYRVSAAGGEPEQLTTLDIVGGERGHHFPHALPGERSILFTLASDSGLHTAILSLDDRSWKVVKQDALDARFDPSGYLVFARKGELLAARYDPASPFEVGTALPIIQDVHTTPGHGGVVVTHFATSSTGKLAFAPQVTPPEEDALVWVDHEGNETPIVSGAGTWMHQRLSPDGKQILFNIQTDDGMLDLYIHSIARGQTQRLTRNGTSYDAEWDPDGKQVVFMSIDTVGRAMFTIPSDFSSPAHKIAAGDPDRRPHLCDWSKDGSTVVYFDRFSVGGLWAADPTGRTEPRQLLNSELKERWGQISDDGRLIAYVGGDASKSERREVYVQRYPDLGQRIRVSVDGGGEPRWSHDAQILFFREDGTLFSATIETDPTLSAGKPNPIFSGDYDQASTGHQHYDLSLDGQQFLMVKHGQRYQPSSLHVIENWVSRLGKDLMP